MQLRDNLSDLKTITDLLGSVSIASELITTLCGKHLGSGNFRAVFDYNLDDKYVIKIEWPGTFCNVVEHHLWDEIQELGGDLAWVKNWFAPVKWISPNGRILVMKKTTQKDKKSPEKVPKFLWDVKSDNFGWIGKNFVCHDYGQFYNMIHYPKGMQKINWEL